MGLKLQTVSYNDFGGGLDLKSSPTKSFENACSLGLNVDYSIDGAVATRNGSSIVNSLAGVPQQISGTPTGLGFYEYKNSDGTSVQIYVAGTTIYHGLSTPAAVVTGLTAGLIPDFEFIVTTGGEYLIFGNGTDTNLKFDGTTWTNLSLPQPTAPTAVNFAAGVLGVGDYDYYVSYAVTVGGIIIQESELSPIGSVTIPANRQIRVTIPTCTETVLAGVSQQCNARVIYRVSPTSAGVAYRLTTITDNVTTTYDDNVVADGTIEADFDNTAAPTSAVFEANDYGEVIYVDADASTDAYASVPYQPWNVPVNSLVVLDGKINCLKRCFSRTLYSTEQKSIWVQNGDSVVEPLRISSYFGILNNRCAVGPSLLYILASNRKYYTISPTDFSQSEMRISEPLSIMIDPLISTIGGAADDQISMAYYTNAGVAKVVTSCPISTSDNNRLIIYNESQSILQESPVWQYWDNINAATLGLFTVDGVTNLYGGDYNGFIWKLDDSSMYGDGAEENGTATSATTTTLTDTTKTWTVNAFTGIIFRVVDGTGEDQFATITSNTADTITFTPAVTTAPDSTSEYTIGGYDAYHFTNWKYVLGSYDILKQLWFIWTNANASGDYAIKLIMQFDFDQTLTNQTEIDLTLAAANTIWGAFIWGEAIWGAQSVFESRFRKFARFRSVRFGFYNRLAGQPFQINGLSVSCQDKQLFFRSAA